MLWAVEVGGRIGLFEADSRRGAVGLARLAAARAGLPRAVSLRCRAATEADVAWVRESGGRVPGEKEGG